MIEELFENSNLSVAKLIEIAKSDFKLLSINEIFCLKTIVFHDNFDNQVLKILIQNSSAPFEGLRPSILKVIAHLEIETVELLLLAIKRLKNSKDFMLGVKYNANYPQFIEIQKKATDNFEKTVALHIQELEAASTVAIIESIKANKTLLEQKRDELIQQYPDIEEQLSSIISEFDVAVTAAQIRVTSMQSSSSSALFVPMFNRGPANNDMPSGPPQQLEKNMLRSSLRRTANR